MIKISNMIILIIIKANNNKVISNSSNSNLKPNLSKFKKTKLAKFKILAKLKSFPNLLNLQI